MKRFLLLLSFAVFVCVSCVDDSYDLSNVETDNISIGENESFEMPLATVTIKMVEFKKEGIDLYALMAEAKTWLPGPNKLPEGANYVDLQKVLSNDTDYIDALLNALMNEMITDTDKMKEVVNKIWENEDYLNEFKDELPINDEEAFKNGFKALFANTPELREITASRAKKYLSGLKVESVDYQIDKIDISDDVVKMLTDNLDDRNTPNAKRKLELYGSVNSALPLSLSCAPLFLTSPIVKVSTILVEPSKEMPINETQIYADDLRHILAGTTVSFPVELLKYYPANALDDKSEIRLTLKLRKTGGLKIDL